MSSLTNSKRTRDDEESSVFNGSDGEAKDEEVDEGDGRSLSPELLPTSNTKKRGRKRAPGNQIERRTAQNRVAQRAFRERKMNYIKDLEAKVEEYKALLESGALPAADGELKIIRLRNKELEEENQLLKRMTSSITFDFKPPTDASDSCTRCSAERMKTLEFMRLNQTLQSRVAALEAECVRLQQSESTGNLMSLNSVPSTSDIQRIMNICQQQPGSPPLSDSLLRHQSAPPGPSTDRPPSASPQPSVRSAEDQWIDVSSNERLIPSCELFGPLKVEAYRFALKQVPALANCSYVDELVDLVVTLTKCTSQKALRKHMVRSISLKHLILDELCGNLLERAHVIELMEEFKVKLGVQHFNHFYENMSRKESFASLQSQVLNRLKPFKEIAKQIPSLSNHEDLIDELCLEFANQSLCTNEEEREEKYIDFLGVSGKLQLLCKTEDERKKLMLAMEVGRESNRKYAQDLKLRNKLF